MRISTPFSILLILSQITIAQSTLYPTTQSYISYLKTNLPAKEEIDVFVNEKGWVKFDRESGYTLNKSLLHDGIDNCNTIVTSQENIVRTQYMYKNLPCRINTYGNSFTQSSQVSDGETWQEYLAAHLGEPIRNYGVGGLGVYQAYRRMLRAETSKDSAEYIILYVWGGDHIRSLLRCRYMLTREWHLQQYQRENAVGKVFHGNFWPNLEMDLNTGKFVEYENRIQTPEDMYKMMNEQWMLENLKDDLALQMSLYKQGKIVDPDIEKLQLLSKHLGLTMDLSNPETLKDNITLLLDKYSFAATKYILEKARDFADNHNRKLMIILFDPYIVTRSLIEKGTRYEQDVVDYLNENQYYYFDMNLVHVEDFKSFNLSFDDYMKRYFNWHYSPAGNHFFAYSIKDKIIEMLDPKPITYTNHQNASMGFENYLEGVSK